MPDRKKTMGNIAEILTKKVAKMLKRALYTEKVQNFVVRGGKVC